MPDAPLPDPAELKPAVDISRRILDQLDRLLLGRTDLHRLTLIGILSRGHILLEGLPGLGKTALVKGLGDILGLGFNRVQFTPDLMPGDILGAHILQERGDGAREFVFQPGPIFTNLLLADEINRASPKTQSALLEAMQERHVTLMGSTRPLPEPFFVLASQNPIELEGTYPLPEAQLDRFLFKLRVQGVDVEVLDSIVSTRRRGEPPRPDWTLLPGDMDTLYMAMDSIVLSRPVSRYVARLVAATHPGAPEATVNVTSYVTYGASPRAAIALAEAGRGQALIEGRPTVSFQDVQTVAPAVLNHRILLSYQAKFDGVDSYAVIDELIRSLDPAELGLPGSVTVEPQREESTPS